MAKVIIYSKAENDMKEIFNYITADSIQNANMILDKFEKAFEQLESFPLSGPEVKDKILLAKGYRMVVVEKYLIMYCVVSDTVQIRRIIHGAAQYKKYLE